MSNYDLSPLAKEMEAKEKARERIRDAAPDLLDLAHNVGGLDDHVVTYGDIRTLRDLIIEWRDAARAAIAKAEGNQ